MARMDRSRRGGMDGINIEPQISHAVPKSLISVQKCRKLADSTTTSGFSIGKQRFSIGSPSLLSPLKGGSMYQGSWLHLLHALRGLLAFGRAYGP